MSGQTRLAALMSAIGTDVSNTKARVLTQELRSPHFYEEYTGGQGMNSGWQGIGYLQEPAVGINKSHVFKTDYSGTKFFNGYIPYSGIYSFGVSAQTSAIVGSSGSRFLVCASSLNQGGGDRYAYAESDPNYIQMFPTVCLFSTRYFSAGQFLSFSFYASGAQVGGQVGFITMFINLDRAY